MQLPERFAWALEVMAVHPTDTVLEIGCGTGILAEPIAQTLTTGTLTALDQSPALISKAVKRNQAWIESKKVRFLTETFANAHLEDRTYDKIIAFNVSLFWTNPAKELQLVKDLLKPDGAFYLFHQPPHDITKSVAKRATEKLEENGFRIEQVLYKVLPVAAVSCLISKPV